MGDLISVLIDNRDEFLAGFWVTVRLVVFSFVIAMVVGTLVAALRISPNKMLQRLGGVYVETFRNIPLLVLLFISFAGLRRAGVGIGPWVAGHREPRPLHRRLRGRGAALRRVLGQQGAGRGRALARLHVPPDAAARRVPAGVPDGDLAARLADHRDDQELGDHRRLAAGAARPAQDRAQIRLAHVRDQRGVLLGRGRLPDADRRSPRSPSARSRSATRSTDEVRLRPRQLGVAVHGQQRPVHPRGPAGQPRDRGHLDGAVADRRARARARPRCRAGSRSAWRSARGSTSGATCR